MTRALRLLRRVAMVILALVLVLAIVFIAGGLALGPKLPPASTTAAVPPPIIDTAPGTDKPVLILLHGAALNAHMWDAVIRGLDPRWRAIAIDLPGHGKQANEAYTLDAGRHAVAEAARRVAPAPVVLVGDSLGGYTAIAAAADVPASQLRGVVAAGAAGDIPAQLPLRDWAVRLLFRWVLALRDERELAPAALTRFEVPPAEAQALLAAGVSIQAVEPAVDALAGVAFGPMLALIPRPVLLLNGSQDAEHMTGEALYLRASPRVSGRHYEGVGHGITLRRPTEFARDLNAFAERAFGLPQPGTKP